MKPIMEHKLVCYITAVVGYLYYQHPSSVSSWTHVITKISYSYCDATNTSVYYSSFGADNLSMGYFFIFLLHKLFGIQDYFTDSKRASYQQFVRSDRGQLYPSTLIQYLSYVLPFLGFTSDLSNNYDIVLILVYSILHNYYIAIYL